MTDVSPPATALWDLNAIFERALAVLRLSDGDVDASRVDEAATQAVARVDADVDRWEPAEPSAAMINEAVSHTVRLYRGKDAPFGRADSWSTDTIGLDVAPDPLTGSRRALLPDKERWGIA